MRNGIRHVFVATVGNRHFSRRPTACSSASFECLARLFSTLTEEPQGHDVSRYRTSLWCAQLLAVASPDASSLNFFGALFERILTSFWEVCIEAANLHRCRHRCSGAHRLRERCPTSAPKRVIEPTCFTVNWIPLTSAGRSASYPTQTALTALSCFF